MVKSIRRVTVECPDAIAIRGERRAFTYSELVQELDRCVAWLRTIPAQRFAIDLENGPAWAVVDLALLECGKVSIPMPGFFSQPQRNHLLHDAGVERILTCSPQSYEGAVATSWVQWGGEEIALVACPAPSTETRALPQDTCKVTYTSGTTGSPKGVCVGSRALTQVVESIVERTAVSRADTHLSLLPLTTLLENVGGLYAALSAGACVVLLSQATVGIQGASGIDPQRFLGQLQQQQATTTILIPQMVDLLVNKLESGSPFRHNLRFVAVGGAAISEEVLRRAAEVELPVYEGYGLSEATSVVSCNVPGENRIGSVGKVLPHVQLRITEDGEIRVKGALFNGYLGEGAVDVDRDGYLATGDLGSLDQQGYLTLQGRKKHLLITAFGRNLAPEWVERELVAQPALLQAVLFGDGRPWNVAVLVASTPSAEVVQHAVERVNRQLPDYARVCRWILAEEPFTVANGEWTGTACPRREEIWKRYGVQIEALYRQHGEESYQ